MKLRQPGCSTAARDLQQTCEKQCGQCWRQRASATNGSTRSIPRNVIPERHFYSSHRSSVRSEEHTSELQSLTKLVCRLLLEKKTAIDYTGADTDKQVSADVAEAGGTP